MEGAEARAKRNLILTHVVLIIMAFIMLVPFAWMILTALKTNQEAISVNPFYISTAGTGKISRRSGKAITLLFCIKIRS